MRCGEPPKQPNEQAVLFDLDGTLDDRDRLAADLFQTQYRLS